MKKLWLIVPILLLTGCAGFPCKKSPLIEVGNPDQLQDCRLLKTFSGPASDRMWGTPYIGDFKNKAMKKAEEMGATHVLWRAESDGIEFVPVLKAYKCPVNSEAFRNRDENSDEE
jgi:hypothetical protein